MLNLILMQLDQGRHVLVEGNVRDYAWDLPGFEAMMSDRRLHCSRHLWCRSGVVDPDTGEHIHRCTQVLASFPLEDRSECLCTSTYPSAPGRQRNAKDIMLLIEFMVDFVRILVPSVRAVLRSPGITNRKEQGDVPESKQSIQPQSRQPEQRHDNDNNHTY